MIALLVRYIPYVRISGVVMSVAHARIEATKKEGKQ